MTDIIIYSTHGCKQCNSVKQLLTISQVAGFEYRNAMDENKMEYIQGLDFGTHKKEFPVMIKDGELIATGKEVYNYVLEVCQNA